MKFIIEKAIADKNADTPQGKSQVLDFLAPLAQSMTDSIVRQEFIKLIAEHLLISEATVHGRLKNNALCTTKSLRTQTIIAARLKAISCVFCFRAPQLLSRRASLSDPKLLPINFPITYIL